MRTHSASSLAVAASMLMLLALSPLAARAAGTASGTSVSCRVLVQCDLCGVAGISSRTTPFLVDNKVNVVVTESDGAATIINANQLAAVTTFTVSNLGNTVQDYGLSANNVASGAPLFGGTDNFDASACVVRVESGANAGYQPAQDILGYIDELAADASKIVYAVCNIPSTLTANSQSVISLDAVTRRGGTPGAQGVVTIQTAGADVLNRVDVVFADAMGSDDASRDGRYSARDAYRLGAQLTLQKTVLSVQDTAGCNAASGCKTVAGSIVTFRIELAATGTGNVDGLVLSDPIPAGMSYVPGSLTVNGAAKTDAADNDNADFSVTTANTVTVTPGNVVAPVTIWFTFRATIN